MIIVRGTESQALPNQLATPQRQYVGEGTALANAGGNVAHVSDRALQYTASLNDATKRLHAMQAGKQYQSTLQNDANALWDGPFRESVERGDAPEASIGVVEKWFEDRRNQIVPSDNPYDATETVYQDVHNDVMAKARPYARTRYLEISRENTSNQLDRGMLLALQADARGDSEGYYNQWGKDRDYLASLKGTIYNDAEVTKLQQAYDTNISTKQAYQTVARDPAQFQRDYFDKKYTHLDPKLAQDLLSLSDTALQRKVTLQDHTDRKQLEQINEQRTVLKNDILTVATTNPATAMARLVDPTTKVFLGPEFDNTLSTVRAMSNDHGVDDPDTIRTLKDAIESHPSEKVRKDLDKAIQNGNLKTATFSSLTTRLTERLDRLTDKRESERHRLTQDEISTRMPMFKVTGIMAFDAKAEHAAGLYRDELQQTLELNPKANIHDTSERLFLKYRQLSIDNFTETAQALLDRYGFKSPMEVTDAYRQGSISLTESDEMLWLLGQGSKTSPSSTPSKSSSPSSSSKTKKKGAF